MAPSRKKIPTYCYQCVNGPDLLNVEVVEGIATEIELNFAVRGLLASLIVSRAVAWQAYYGAVSRAGAPICSLDVLGVLRLWLLLAGTVVPIASVFVGAWMFASLAVIAVDGRSKFMLVTHAGYQHGFALEHAGVVLKPGWIGGEASA